MCVPLIQRTNNILPKSGICVYRWSCAGSPVPLVACGRSSAEVWSPGAEPLQSSGPTAASADDIWNRAATFQSSALCFCSDWSMRILRSRILDRDSLLSCCLEAAELRLYRGEFCLFSPQTVLNVLHLSQFRQDRGCLSTCTYTQVTVIREDTVLLSLVNVFRP